jgi:hypothetical protein
MSPILLMLKFPFSPAEGKHEVIMEVYDGWISDIVLHILSVAHLGSSSFPRTTWHFPGFCPMASSRVFFLVSHFFPQLAFLE